jgi:hypothetical protein
MLVRWPALFALAFVAGCGAPEPPGSTGGTNVTPGACGRGLVVVSTDYQSSNVSLVGLDGAVLSSSFISSATTDAQLSAKLGGDVVPPTPLMGQGSIVLLDRYPNAVLTWLDVKSAKVTGQLSAGTKTNSRDYLELGPDKAYVTRLDTSAGIGSDILVLDPTQRVVTGSIELGATMTGEPAELGPAPNRLLEAQGKVVVSLLATTSDHQKTAASRLVQLDPDTDSILSVLVLDGLYECNGLALSPDAERVALSCSGRFNGSSKSTLSESGLVVVELAPQLKESFRMPATSAPFGFAVAWAGPHTLVTNTFGAFADGSAPERPDRIVEIDTETNETHTLLEAAAFTLSDVRCASKCGVCFATDADQAVLRRFAIGDDGHLKPPTSITVDDAIGLPPQALGQF